MLVVARGEINAEVCAARLLAPERGARDDVGDGQEVSRRGLKMKVIAFDPYLSSKNLADALQSQPPGQLIEGDAYYAFSSVFSIPPRVRSSTTARTSPSAMGTG